MQGTSTNKARNTHTQTWSSQEHAHSLHTISPRVAGEQTRCTGANTHSRIRRQQTRMQSAAKPQELTDPPYDCATAGSTNTDPQRLYDEQCCTVRTPHYRWRMAHKQRSTEQQQRHKLNGDLGQLGRQQAVPEAPTRSMAGSRGRVGGKRNV